jgi:hypothetical protein
MTKNQHELNAKASAQIEIDYLREEIAKLKERAKDVFNAREVLKKHGYYTNNLWHVGDVTQVHPMSEEKAYEVLDKVMRGEGVVNHIQDVIAIAVDLIEEEQ